MSPDVTGCHRWSLDVTINQTIMKEDLFLYFTHSHARTCLRKLEVQAFSKVLKPIIPIPCENVLRLDLGLPAMHQATIYLLGRRKTIENQISELTEQH